MGWDKVILPILVHRKENILYFKSKASFDTTGGIK